MDVDAAIVAGVRACNAIGNGETDDAAIDNNDLTAYRHSS